MVRRVLWVLAVRSFGEFCAACDADPRSNNFRTPRPARTPRTLRTHRTPRTLRTHRTREPCEPCEPCELFDMRIAVTGSTGFIGRHVVAALSSRGVQVRAIVRPSAVARPFQGRDPGGPERPALQPEIVRASLADPALTETFRDCDAVVHLAGVVSTVDDREYAAVNVGGTRA